MEKFNALFENFTNTYFTFLTKITASNGSKIIIGMFIFSIFIYLLANALYGKKRRAFRL